MNDNTVNRQSYIHAITKLLNVSDVRHLRLVWIFASGIIKRTEK